MIGINIKFTIILCLSSYLIGCVGQSSLQTAETLAQGQWVTIGSFGTQNSSRYHKVDSTILPSQNQKTILVPELRVHYGYSHSLQVNGVLSSPYSLGIEFKYSYCHGTVKCAFGMSYQTSPLAITGADGPNDDELDLEVHDLKLPVFFSMRWDWFAPYLTVKYVNRSIRKDIRRNLNQIEFDSGIVFGRWWGFITEYSFNIDFSSSYQNYQMTIGYFYKQ